eukprot:9119161-Pyramimonas_sp.AAC.1
MQGIVDRLIARGDYISEGAQKTGRELGVSSERAHVSDHGLQVPEPLIEEHSALTACFAYASLT